MSIGVARNLFDPLLPGSWEPTVKSAYNTKRGPLSTAVQQAMSRDSMTAVRGAHSHNASSTAPKENGQNSPPNAVNPNTNFAHPPPADNADDTPVSSAVELTQTWVQFARTFVLIFPIYALGYFEFSFSWLLIGLAIFFWWRRNTRGKNSRLSRALAFFEQEERSVKQSLTTSDLPPWVRCLKTVIPQGPPPPIQVSLRGSRGPQAK